MMKLTPHPNFIRGHFHLALIEGCRHSLEISIPVQEVEAETSRVTEDVQKRARLRGFRPGKAPISIIRKEFGGDIRQRVLESLIPKHLEKEFETSNLNVVGQPDIKDVHFHDGEPLRFTAEFEVVPEIELGEYQGVEVPYQDPEVSDEDVEKRLNEIREQKAQYVNVDPRPIEKGDFAVVSLESVAGVEGEPVRQDEMVLEVGGADTFEAFTENLLGLTPGDEKEFEVEYPEEYAAKRLAGKKVTFHATVKGIRRKELPDANDELAQELGDYRDLAELKEAIRAYLDEKGYVYHDYGVYSAQRADYPDQAALVARSVAAGEFEQGIVVCGTGIGVAIAANKVKGIRAALCHDVFSATMARQHNDSNILTLGARVIGVGHALEIVEAYLAAGFLGERHQIRVDKITELEG
jgi:RpiB/LacA/LacB family sugar-phosphate isomerase